MMKQVRWTIVAAAALACGCSSTVLVSVPPRVDLARYGTLGIVHFDSGSDASIDSQATRQFEERVQAAQPGTPFIDLGTRRALLAALGSADFDPATVKRIGAKYGVGAVFVGEVAYSKPKTDIRVIDLSKLEGAVRSEIRADLSSRLIETRTGASVWSNSAWATRRIGDISVSADYGLRGGVSEGDPRSQMIPGLVYAITGDFRPSTERRPAK